MTDMPMLAVPLKTDEHGVIRVMGTRIPIDTVIARYHQGETPEGIHHGFPTLSVSDIWAVIAYYLAHRAELDTYLETRDAESARTRQEIEANYPPELKARIEQLRVLAKPKRDNKI